MAGTPAIAALGKEETALSVENTSKKIDQFQWSERSHLTWNDFRGTAKNTADGSAAATNCSIGFRVYKNTQDGKKHVLVYNVFYATRSWVKPDGMLPSVLEHEQGHFDLCEIYTRKLRNRIDDMDFSIPDVMQALMSVYGEVSAEYETRQQAYEQETIHGTNISEQKRWQAIMAMEITGNYATP